MGKGEIALHLETWGWPGPEGAGASSQRVVECSPDVGNECVVEFEPKKGGLWKWETLILLQAVN